MFCTVRTSAVVLINLAMLLLAGCGGGSGYQGISGSVTFQGQPLDEGSVQFFSAGANPVPQAGAMIYDGYYKIPGEHGLKPGTYLVKISSTEEIENKEGSSMNPFLVRERIPSRYNTQSTLTVEIRAGDRGPFNFKLE